MYCMIYALVMVYALVMIIEHLMMVTHICLQVAGKHWLLMKSRA